MTTALPLANRAEAGRLLAEKLAADSLLDPGALVLGLVRGGAVVAKHLADASGLDWDILIVRKIGAPRQPEYAAAAYAESGALVVNEYARRELRLDDEWFELQALRAAQECQRLQMDLRGEAAPPVLDRRKVILTDDGMATGLSMHAAIKAARDAGALSITVAVPVLAPDALADLERQRIEHSYLACPGGFHAVGQFYVDFVPVSTIQVRQLLESRAA